MSERDDELVRLLELDADTPGPAHPIDDARTNALVDAVLERASTEPKVVTLPQRNWVRLALVAIVLSVTTIAAATAWNYAGVSEEERREPQPPTDEAEPQPGPPPETTRATGPSAAGSRVSPGRPKTAVGSS